MGATQNTNESFNSILWKMCPKEGFCSVDTVQLAANLAVLSFNHGTISLLAVLKELGCYDGEHTRKALQLEDTRRVKKAQRKVSREEKQQRMKRRRRRKGWEESTIDQEGTTYDAGGFYTPCSLVMVIYILFFSTIFHCFYMCLLTSAQLFSSVVNTLYMKVYIS